ncbi:MAG: hypothetical protein QI223_06440 [Candidatus Korarchaeota archaeon]|nr:hypothetical protein [Candidatus Korarchaeota archaeon]
MDVGKSLTVTRYLLKNYVINPFIKRFKTVVLGAVVIGIIAGGLVAVAIALSHSEPEVQVNQTEESEPSLGRSLREALLRAGLDKRDAVAGVSAMLALSLLLMVTLGKAAISVMEEAEYELLLAQPLDMGTYVLGRELAEFARASLTGLPYLGLAPFVYRLNGGNMLKAALFPLALLTIIAFLSALSTLISVVKIVARDRERLLRLAVLAYFSAGAVHSLLSWGISSTLSLPFRPLAEALVYCATISEGMNQVLASWGMSIAIILGLEAIVIKLADWASPEYVRPVSELVRESWAKAAQRGVSLYSPDPGAALFRYAFSLDVLSLRHLRNLVAVAVASGVAGFILLRVGPKFGLEPSAASFGVSFMVPLIVGEMAMFIVGTVMARDLAAMWVFRVYALELRPLASGLILKYATYLSEAFLAIGIFDAVLLGQPLALLLPAAVLPITMFTVLLLLVSTCYLASKRRIVRQMPTGLYMFEDVALLVISVLVMPAYMLATLLFTEILLPRLTLQTTLLALAASASLSWAVYEASRRVLAETMRVWDLAS